MRLLSALADPRGAPGFDTGDKNLRRGLWMVKHRGGRERAKRRRCAFVVGEECGNVPAPCQTALKGVRPHSAGVGKPARDGAHTGRRGCSCMGLPEDMRTRERSREKRENPKKKRGFGRPGSRVCLCPLTPPPTPPQPISSSHATPPTHKVAVRVCVSLRESLLLLGLCLPGALWEMRVTACTVQLPVWPTHGAQGCVWCTSSAFYRTCRRYNIFIDNIN